MNSIDWQSVHTTGIVCIISCDTHWWLKELTLSNLFFPQGPSDSLGVSIAGGVGSPLGDVPIFIAMMHANGLVAQTGKLRVSLTI